MLALKRKPQPKPIANSTKPAKRLKIAPGTPKTSAQSPKNSSRHNLTLSDWLTVYAYIDAHPNASQANVVQHFTSLETGALLFDQSTLSRKVRERPKLEARANDNPNALSSKRPRIVTRPDVERGLFLWVKDMEKKGETVSGPMLREKRRRFEKQFQVPDDEKLEGSSWVRSFCRTYNIREICRHGEAASIDQDAVEAERLRCRQVVARFSPQDRFNVDETAFNPYSPPDRGLATKQMSGKKKEKFRITIALACNSDGSEMLEPFFIGKATKPRCFGHQTPVQRGFYYRNNKTAWMTSELFEEWVKKLDLRMKRKNRQILLLMDNFSGHKISYQPSNIQMEFFAPNMTPYVQPCDAGIIRCFKAHYRRYFNERAINRDEAGEREIYKIDLLDAILMARRAWSAVTSETVQNCWNHTLIQPETFASAGLGTSTTGLPSSSQSTAPHADAAAWEIIHEFAMTDLSLPNAEIRLQAHLGNRYIDSDWQPALKAVMDAEGSTEVALKAIHDIENEAKRRPGIVIRIVPSSHQDIPQISEAETQLMQTVQNLKARNRIFGEPPTLGDLLEPPEEKEIRAEPSDEPDKTDEVIAHIVSKEIAAVDAEVIEDNSDDEDEPVDPPVTRANASLLCEQLEQAVKAYGDAEEIMTLTHHLYHFRANLRRQELLNAQQATLDRYFK